MYLITVEQGFAAAHSLRNYGGKCETLHGHNFKVVVTVRATGVNDTGLGYDFTVLKQQLKEVLSQFDHTNLNEVPPFTQINPSSENIATTIFSAMGKKLSGAPVSLDSVEVWESSTSHVLYKPG